MKPTFAEAIDQWLSALMELCTEVHEYASIGYCKSMRVYMYV